MIPPEHLPQACLVVIETHPIQYQAPVYRIVQERLGIPVTAIYGSDFSVVGYHDDDFATTVRWEGELLSGYSYHFLTRARSGSANPMAGVSCDGLTRLLRRLRPEVVLLSGYGGPFYRGVLRRLWFTNYPIVFRGDSTDHVRSRGALFGWARDRALQCFYRRCAALLPVGLRSYEHYLRLGVPNAKLIFAPRCVDTAPLQMEESRRSVLRKETRQALGIGDDRIVLLFSGKLIAVKAVDLLLRACKQLPVAQRERLTVVFVGDGPLKDDVQRLAANPPASDVRFAGFQTQRLLSRFYHAADLLVLPSHSESWGLVVNEAMHHGLPCVVSDRVACAADLVEPGVTGEVFEAGSLAGLGAAIGRAVGLVGWPEVRDRCRANVADYTADKAAEGIAEAYFRARNITFRVNKSDLFHSYGFPAAGPPRADAGAASPRD
jgi:glycosyltransferase involved in cell wall biosynthesis